MPGILDILRNTPWWVFALLALLTWLGFQALRPRTLPIWRLLITPAIFIGWGVTSLALQSMSSPILIADWSVTAAVGAAIAWTTSRLHNVVIDRARQHVSLPGSAFPLIRNLLIFSAKYGLGSLLRSCRRRMQILRFGILPFQERALAISWVGWPGSRRFIDAGLMVANMGPQNVDTVLIAGKVMKRNGAMLGVSYDRLTRLGDEARDRLYAAAKVKNTRV